MIVLELIDELNKEPGDRQVLVLGPDYTAHEPELKHFMGGGEEPTALVLVASHLPYSQAIKAAVAVESLPPPKEPVKGYAAKYTSYPHAYWCKSITKGLKCTCVGGDIVLDKDQ